MDKITLGKRVREARLKRVLAQHVLAEKAGIGIMYLGEIERGVKMPSMNIFIKLIEALDISADYVLRDELSSGERYIYFVCLLPGNGRPQARSLLWIHVWQ